jgi:putative transposase
MAGIDFGTDNIAAIVTTDHASRVYKGGAVLAKSRLFHKERAKAISILTKGKKHARASSRHLDHLSRKHDGFMRDAMHKISADIIRFCLEHRVGTVVIGTNPMWKQRTDMGGTNNQNFASVPHAMLKWMITYKAKAAGIRVICQEESYTSKADVTAGDQMPVYGKEEGKDTVFSGRRISRGLYRCGNGVVVNADCNGAANILRKAFPDAWDGTYDFRFLARPEAATYQTLNRSRAAG